MKNKKLNKTFLKKINELAHTKDFFKKLKIFNSKYDNFDNFINDFEIFQSSFIDIPSKKLSTQDQIFEGIISRLDTLSNYKNLVIKIYLESQKKPKYFLTINKHISSYFRKFIKNPLDFSSAYLIYIYAFNVWIEDSNDMDRTMALIGNSFENINKFKSFFYKND